MDQKSLETVFLIAICRQSGDKWQSKTLFLKIFYLHSSIVLTFLIAAYPVGKHDCNVFSCIFQGSMEEGGCLSTVVNASFFLPSFSSLFGPRHNKACLRGFRQSKTQTSLLSYRDWLENWNFPCYKFRYDTFQKANNKGAYQTAQMRRLVCTFVVRKPPEDSFSRIEVHRLSYNVHVVSFLY